MGRPVKRIVLLIFSVIGISNATMVIFRNGQNTPGLVNGATNYNIGKINGQRGFRPTDLGSTLKVWIDPSSETYNNGDSIATAHDRSGGGLDYTQAVALTKPTFQTSGINGRKAFAFNGSQMLNGPAGTLSLAQNQAAVSLFGVFTMDNSSSNRCVWGWSNGLAMGNSRVSLRTDAGGNADQSGATYRRLDAATATSLPFGSALSVPQQNGGVFNFAGNLVSLYRNDIAGATGTFPSGAGNSENTASIAASIGSLGTVAGGGPFTGSTGDLVFVQTALSGTSLAYMNRYLMAKYGTGGYR